MLHFQLPKLTTREHSAYSYEPGAFVSGHFCTIETSHSCPLFYVYATDTQDQKFYCQFLESTWCTEFLGVCVCTCIQILVQRMCVSLFLVQQ